MWYSLDANISVAAIHAARGVAGRLGQKSLLYGSDDFCDSFEGLFLQSVGDEDFDHLVVVSSVANVSTVDLASELFFDQQSVKYTLNHLISKRLLGCFGKFVVKGAHRAILERENFVGDPANAS